MEPAGNLIEVFARYSGNVIFHDLIAPGGGGGAVLGRVGWIFTAFGGVFVLWGFTLRLQQAGAGDRVAEVARTWVILALMGGAPFLMRAVMESADGLYDSSIGGPGNLAFACVRAAYLLPSPLTLLSAAPPARPSQAAMPPDATVQGAAEGAVTSIWSGVAHTVGSLVGDVTSAIRTLSLASGFYLSVVRSLMVLGTFIPVCGLFIAASAVIWFMDQLRFFLAVVGTMMLPLFIGMYSMPSGHHNRQAAQAYLMNMLSLALWPVSWLIGHTGTIVLFDALASLIAGSGRVPDLTQIFSWSVLSHPVSLSTAQVQAEAAALGNWFMGDLVSLLAVAVGSLGFVIWVFTVSIAGPMCLHRMLAAGEMYFSQALTASRQAALTTASAAVTVYGMRPKTPTLANAPKSSAPDPITTPSWSGLLEVPKSGGASLRAASGLGDDEPSKSKKGGPAEGPPWERN